MVPSDTSEPCELYYFPFSLYSIMVRAAIAFANRQQPGKLPEIQLRMVNLHVKEHVSEWYLKINPKGEVCLTLTSHSASGIVDDLVDLGPLHDVPNLQDAVEG
jgi:hypothetical protein